ncbi:unnamed protein product, partial [Prorocentrum cordatum]
SSLGLGSCSVLRPAPARHASPVMRSDSLWESEDVLNAVFVLLGPSLVCAVGSVARAWRHRAEDPALWAQLLPGSGGGGPRSIGAPARAVREGRRLAVAELGGAPPACARAVALLDLLGDALALCESAPSSSPGEWVAVEVHDLRAQGSSRRRRFEKVTRGATALRLLDGSRHVLVAGSCPSRPLALLDYSSEAPHGDCSREASTQTIDVRQADIEAVRGLASLPPAGPPISWLARVSGDRAVGAQE